MKLRPGPRLALLIGMLAVSSAAILFRFTTAPPFVVATYRLGIAGLFMLSMAGHKLIELKKLEPKELALLIISGLFLAVHFSAWFYSLRYTTIAASTVIVTSSPIVILICSWILLGERPKGRRWGTAVFCTRMIATIFSILAFCELEVEDEGDHKRCVGFSRRKAERRGSMGRL